MPPMPYQMAPIGTTPIQNNLPPRPTPPPAKDPNNPFDLL